MWTPPRLFFAMLFGLQASNLQQGLFLSGNVSSGPITKLQIGCKWRENLRSVIMRSIVVSVFLCAGLTAFAQTSERAQLPADELELRTQLESDKSMIQLTCGLLMPIDPKEMYAKEGTVQQAENTRLRRKFFEAVTKYDSIRAAYTCGTDEGGTIKKYLLSERGKLTSVDDYSRDPFGGLRITLYDCWNLAMGHYITNEEKEIVFEEFGAHDADGKVVFLSCTSTNPDRRKIIF